MFTRGEHNLYVILLVIMAIVYVRYNLRRVEQYEILQVTSGKLTPDILEERKPVVVQKGAKIVEDVICIAMRYLYLYKTPAREATPCSFVWVNAKYSVIFTPPDVDAPVELEILHSRYKNDANYQSVAVALNAGCFLILPCFWAYRVTCPPPAGRENPADPDVRATPKPRVRVIDMHNAFSVVYGMFNSGAAGSAPS